MAFDPGLKIGQVISRQQISDIFKVAIMGGMLKNNDLNTLVIIADHTVPPYDDKWQDGVLHYTGMGKKGDQSINFKQNKTLAQSRTNGVSVYLFEVYHARQYIYSGKVKLVGEPYQAEQPDENGVMRKVWIFPVRPDKIVGGTGKPEDFEIPEDVAEEIRKQAISFLKKINDINNHQITKVGESGEMLYQNNVSVHGNKFVENIQGSDRRTWEILFFDIVKEEPTFLKLHPDSRKF